MLSNATHHRPFAFAAHYFIQLRRIFKRYSLQLCKAHHFWSFSTIQISSPYVYSGWFMALNFDIVLPANWRSCDKDWSTLPFCNAAASGRFVRTFKPLGGSFLSIVGVGGPVKCGQRVDYGNWVEQIEHVTLHLDLEALGSLKCASSGLINIRVRHMGDSIHLIFQRFRTVIF